VINILFLHSAEETFVRLDRDLLGSFANVLDLHVPSKFPVRLSRYWNGIRHADLVFCWFASWNALWALLGAKAMGKRSILVVGGYDLASLPEAGYGNQRGGPAKYVSRLAINLATELFTNSYYSQTEAAQNAGVEEQRIRVIYHGIPDPFGRLPNSPRQSLVLTVGRVDAPNLRRKGIESFVRAAELLPGLRFVVVGPWADGAVQHLRSIAPRNVTLTGQISDDELHGYYGMASVYVQASLHEGFGMSVAESMLAGCIPVLTRGGALPEVAGDCGVYIADTLPQSIAHGVRIAMGLADQDRARARQRILEKFPLSERKAQLEQLVSECLGGQRSNTG
jgi:glycosyltransferase involved in cell wall biosynthesis